MLLLLPAGLLYKIHSLVLTIHASTAQSVVGQLHLRDKQLITQCTEQAKLRCLNLSICLTV